MKNPDDEIRLTRKEAAQLIEGIRLVLSLDRPSTCVDSGDWAKAQCFDIGGLLDGAGISPLRHCTGLAHDDLLSDDCSQCAPRWGFVGPRVVVR